MPGQHLQTTVLGDGDGDHLTPHVKVHDTGKRTTDGFDLFGGEWQCGNVIVIQHKIRLDLRLGDECERLSLDTHLAHTYLVRRMQRFDEMGCVASLME